MNKLLYVLCLGLFACGTTTNVNYPIGTTEAAIMLPESNKRIVTLNRVRLDYSVVTRDGHMSPNSTDALMGSINGFNNGIKSRKYFNNIAQISNFQQNANGIFPDSLSVEELKQVARDADFVVALEMFDQYYSDRYNIEIRRQEVGEKTYREVDYFVGRRTIYVTVGWRVYSAKTGQLLDEQVYEEDYFYEAESLRRINATQLLENNFRREMSNLGFRLGSKFASRISPTKHYTYRTIYTKGNDHLEKAAIDVRAEDWTKAEEHWQRGIKREKKRKKLAKLYHNLAMAAEKSGNLTQAKEYAKLAANQHPIGVKTQSLVGY
ncbi:MAG: hypothetical protein KJP21_09315 [Bacteroidia bacterium]|nr:hypothetical protein [Bacteroidia bacterium]